MEPAFPGAVGCVTLELDATTVGERLEAVCGRLLIDAHCGLAAGLEAGKARVVMRVAPGAIDARDDGGEHERSG